MQDCWLNLVLVLQVIKNLSPYKDGKLKKADFRRVVHTGTLWQLPVSGVKATTDTEASVCLRTAKSAEDAQTCQ